MRCQECSVEIPDDSNFCPSCGKPPQRPGELFCPACYAKSASGQRFCAECGAQMALTGPTDPPGQPRKVTSPPVSTLVSSASQSVVRSSLPLAGVLIRCGAALIDVVLLYILGFIMALAFGQTIDDGFELHGFAGFLWWVIAFTYYIVFESKFGATPAKMLLGLRVIKIDGGACDTKAAIIRTVSRLVDNFLLLGVVCMLFSKRNQRLGDHFADTLLVKTRAIKLSQIKSDPLNKFDD